MHTKGKVSEIIATSLENVGPDGHCIRFESDGNAIDELRTALPGLYWTKTAAERELRSQ